MSARVTYFIVTGGPYSIKFADLERLKAESARLGYLPDPTQFGATLVKRSLFRTEKYDYSEPINQRWGFDKRRPYRTRNDA